MWRSQLATTPSLPAEYNIPPTGDSPSRSSVAFGSIAKELTPRRCALSSSLASTTYDTFRRVEALMRARLVEESKQ